MTTHIELIGQYVIRDYANNTYSTMKDFTKDCNEIMGKINIFIEEQTKFWTKLYKGIRRSDYQHFEMNNYDYNRNDELYNFLKANAKYLVKQINKTYGAKEGKALHNNSKCEKLVIERIVGSAFIIMKDHIMELANSGQYMKARALSELPELETVMYVINNKLV